MKFQVVEEVARDLRQRYETIDIDGARILFPEGWGLVRASNTNPYLTLRFEARTAAGLAAMKRLVYDAAPQVPERHAARIAAGVFSLPRLRSQHLFLSLSLAGRGWG